MVMLQIISHLSSLDRNMRAPLLDWVYDAAREQSVKEVALAKMLASMLLTLQHGRTAPSVPQQLGMDAYISLGRQTHAEDIATKPRTFDIVCPETQVSNNGC